MADLTSESTTSLPSQGESSVIPSTMTDNVHTGLRITTSPFNGQNYLAWSQNLTIFLKSKGKMGYEITNSLIMGWLIHSMVSEIEEGYFNGWKPLDHLQDYKPVCPTNFADYRKFVAQEQVFKFLEGLNVEYDPVWSRVNGMDVLHSL
ncbi:hypothetical protein CsSME_00041034 [Camellia sinensis var. sinensis]